MKFEIIKSLSKEEDEVIGKFVSNHPESTYFQSPLFFKACLSTKKLSPAYILAYDQNVLTGVLLVFRQVQINKPVLKFLSSRNIIWGGPLVKDNNPDIYKGLYKAYEELTPRALYTQVRNLSNMDAFREIMISMGFNYEDHLDIIIDLQKNEEELWNAVDAKGKNKIRKAVKEGTSFEVKNDEIALAESYAILKEVYSRAKLPLPDEDHFQAMLRNSNDRDGLKIFIAKDGAATIGCLLGLAYDEAMFCYYAGAYASAYKKYPNDMLPWEVFKWAKNAGFTKFDFGGAGKPNVPYGVRDYKMKFGGQLVCFGRFEKIHLPILYKIATIGLAGWKKLRK